MKTKRVLMLGVIMTFILATSFTSVASAKEAVVPFRAYYPVWAVATFDPSCGCIQQVFTPGGDGRATHMGLSLFSGDAHAWPGQTTIQKGVGTLTAANGDSMDVYYEGTVVVIDNGAHIVVDGWYEVTGGTGRFLDVTGGGTYHVYVYTDNSQPNGLWFEGDLHK
jgi:hypothetical protein